jgi:hypothetical protein
MADARTQDVDNHRRRLGRHQPGKPTINRVPPLSRRDWILLVSLSLLALATAALGIGSKSLWFDEGYSAELARQSGGKWWRLVWEQEAGSILHALLLKPWAAVSDGDAWLRFLSVPFSVGQVVLTFLLARRFVVRPAWVVVLALAVNGTYVQYAQEARGYAMASFLVLAATLAFLRAVESPTTGRLGLYVALAALCPLSHVFTAPFIVVHGVVLVVFATRRQLVARWAGAGAAVGVAWAGFALIVLAVGSPDARPGDSVPDRVTSLAHVPRQFLAPDRILGWTLMVGAALWIGRLVAVAIAERRSEAALVTAVPPLMVGLPLVVALLAPQIDLSTSRYFVPILPFLLMMATGGIGWLGEWRQGATWLIPLGLALVVAMSGSGLVRWHVDAEKMDARTWTALLADRIQESDRVVFDDVFARIVTEHYVNQGDLDLTRATSVRPDEPFGEYFWNPVRDEVGECLLDTLDIRREVSHPGRTWIILSVPERCRSGDMVVDAIGETGRTVVERIDLDGPATVLLVV